MEEKELISRSSRSYIEAPLRGVVSHCRDAAASARGRNHAQEHNVALIALESVGVAAYDLSPLHLFWTELTNEARFDLTRLSIADEADDAECLARIGGFMELGPCALDATENLPYRSCGPWQRPQFSS